MSISLITFVFLVFLGPVKAEVASAENHRLDLKRALQFAIDNSPSFDSLKKRLRISQLEEKSAAAKLLPSLDLNTTHGILDASPRRATTQPLTGWESEFNLSLTESLYDNGVSQTKSRIATLNRKQAELYFVDQKNKLTLEIASQFLQYSLNIKLLEIQEKQFKLVNKQYGVISKDYYQGIKTKKDFLRFKTQVSRGEIDLTSAKNAVEKSKQELLRLIGVQLQTKSEIDFEPISFDVKNDIVSDFSLKIEDHLQFRAAKLQKEINQFEEDLVARKNLPEWDLSAGVQYGSSSYIGTGQSFSDNATTGWNVLLNVKYNIFDWGIRSRDKEVALYKALIQSNDLDSSLLTLKSSLNQLKINFVKIKKNFELSKELLSLEESNIEFIQREYRNGKVQYLDLISGLNNLSDAEIKFYSAASDLQIVKYTALYHQGKLYDEITQ